MAKFALLIGVSEYESGLETLPGSVLDVDALWEVLVHPEMGGFVKTDVIILKNPQNQEMADRIDDLFANRSRDDLLLLYFSGHGVRDERGQLYLANSNTRKYHNGKLKDTTAVSANLLQNKFNDSKSQHQVIILDCCFSGAIVQGMMMKDDGVVDVNAYLGGKGRAILTSSTATQYSLGPNKTEETGLSVYTHYLIEGIKTGAADTDNDGYIGVDELHDYAARCVKEKTSGMTPKFYPVEEGYKIRLAKSPLAKSRKDDPVLQYREEVYRKVEQGLGKLSIPATKMLINKGNEWGLSAEIAKKIFIEILQFYRDYERKLWEYEQTFTEAVEEGEIQYEEGKIQYLSPIIEADWHEYRQYLKLKDLDIAKIEARILLPLQSGYQTLQQPKVESVSAQNSDQVPQNDPQLVITLSGKICIKSSSDSIFGPENDPIIYQTAINQSNPKEKIIVVSDRGKAYPIFIKQIPSAEIHRISLLDLLPETVKRDADKVIGKFFFPESTADYDLLLITKNGRLKRLLLSELINLTSRGLSLIKFKDQDEDSVQHLSLIHSSDNLVLVTTSGRLLRFPLTKESIFPTGRNSQGNPAIRLRFGESLVNCLPVKPTDNLLLLTQLGYGKSFPVESLRLGVLGDIGTTAIQFSNKTDQLVAMLPFLSQQRLLLLTNHNRQLSLSSEEFKVWSKDGVGDRLIELETDELIDLAVLNMSSN